MTNIVMFVLLPPGSAEAWERSPTGLLTSKEGAFMALGSRLVVLQSFMVLAASAAGAAVPIAINNGWSTAMQGKDKTVLVLGASGGIGGEVVSDARRESS